MFNLAKKKILIVEDFAEFARSLRAMLHPMGATDTDIVNNAQDAIERCKATKYDIILSDYNLGPKKDGQQLLEELQHFQLIKSSCVFIMITAENTTSMVMAAVEYVPDSYIAKPFNGNLLESRLQKSIQRKEALVTINRAIRNKQWETALNEIAVVVKAQPKYRMSCLRAKITALKHLGKFEAALEIANSIVSVRSIPWALESIGELHYLLGDNEQSIAVFKNLIAEFPMSVEGYDWLAKLQQLSGQSLDAQETLMEAIKRSPKVIRRQKQLGKIAEENNDLQAMAQAYRAAIKHGAFSTFSSPEEYLKLGSAITREIRSSKDQVEDSKSDSGIAKQKAEFEQTLNSVLSKFPKDQSNILRTKIAQSSFCEATGDQQQSHKLLEEARELYQSMDLELSEDVSLEIVKTLNEIGETEFADEIIETAMQQHIEDDEFIVKAAKVCNNQNLLLLFEKAKEINILAIEHFNNKEFSKASVAFSQALEIAPKNVNIVLNYAQTLLKEAQKSQQKETFVAKANQALDSIPCVVFPDPRHERYNELKRLIKLLMQQTQ